MPRRLRPERPEDPETVARIFVEAFNEGDLDRFVSVLAEDVVLHSMKAEVNGPEAARQWATRAPGGVQQTIEVVDSRVNGDAVLFEVDRVWRWAEDGTHASTDEMAWLLETDGGGLITSWRPFEDRAEAVRVFETDPA